MPYLKIRLSAAALCLLTGCATSGFFAASPASKPNADPAAPSGPRPSAFTSSWSGTQKNADRAPQDTGLAAGAAAGDIERRIQELLAAGERKQSTGDRRAARTAYEQVLRLAPGDASANYQLAIMDDEEGHFADAEAHYFTVLKQTPNDPNVLSSMGWSYLIQGRYDDSDRILREALRFDPNNKFALNNLGMLYGTRGDYDGALTIFRQAGSEADAQNALALLKQNAGTVLPAGEQYSAAPATSAGPQHGNSARPTVVNLPDSRGLAVTADPEHSTPEARKFAEDYKRLKAESDIRQQGKRARVAQKNMSAPSPWNNNRQGAADASQRDSGRAIPAAGQADMLPSDIGTYNPQINGRYPANDAAFPGAAPSQANRARLADPADFGPAGNSATSANRIPVLNPGKPPIPGTQTIYEQPAGPNVQGYGTQGQSRSPIITPAGESPTGRVNNSPSWNSLPPDDSNRGNSNGENGPAPAGRLSDWPRDNTGNPNSTDQSIRNSTGQPATSGQFNAAQSRGRNSRQDAQTTAAQLGLSAGSGGLGFPASDWPSSQNGQIAGPRSGLMPPGPQNTPGSQIPPSGQNSLGSQNVYNPQSDGQQSTVGGQSQGFGPLSPTSNSPGSSLPPWPGRPLSGGSVPQAVVPSAQGLVYGSTGDSGLPNFYSGRPTAPPVR